MIKKITSTNGLAWTTASHTITLRRTAGGHWGYAIRDSWGKQIVHHAANYTSRANCKRDAFAAYDVIRGAK